MFILAWRGRFSYLLKDVGKPGVVELLGFLPDVGVL
jgi:hypothetical protein